jgi:hypothetical protein
VEDKDIIFQHPVALGHQGKSSTKTHTTKMYNTLKSNIETAAKNDRMKISYQGN